MFTPVPSVEDASLVKTAVFRSRRAPESAFPCSTSIRQDEGSSATHTVDLATPVELLRISERCFVDA